MKTTTLSAILFRALMLAALAAAWYWALNGTVTMPQPAPFHAGLTPALNVSPLIETDGVDFGEAEEFVDA